MSDINDFGLGQDFAFDPTYNPDVDWEALLEDMNNSWEGVIDENTSLEVPTQTDHGITPPDPADVPAMDGTVVHATGSTNGIEDTQPNSGNLPEPDMPLFGASFGDLSPIDFGTSFDPNQMNGGDVPVSGTDDQERYVEPQMLQAQDLATASLHTFPHFTAPDYPPASTSASFTASRGHYPPPREMNPDPGSAYWTRNMQQQALTLASADASRAPGAPQSSPGDLVGTGDQVDVSGEDYQTPPTTASVRRTVRFADPAAPETPRPIAPLPQSSAPTPAVPAKKPTSRKSTSKAKQEANKVPIFNNQLLVADLAAAEAEAIKRITLKVANDDRDAVAAHPEIWIPRITKAFDVDFRAQPENPEHYTQEGITEFDRWQKEHENKVWAIFKEQNDPSKFAQSCAWIFYDLVLDSHANGLHHVAKTIANGGADTAMKCSDRINAAIKAMEQYSIVKYDFLRQDRLDGLAASPVGFVRRKVENMFVNYKKKKDTGPVRVDGSDETGSKTKTATKTKTNKPQAKRKRKAASPDPSDDEGDEVPDDGYNGDDGDDESARPTKRAKARSKRMDSDASYR